MECIRHFLTLYRHFLTLHRVSKCATRHATRVARREAEIEALKKALCVLDEEDGEIPECAGKSGHREESSGKAEKDHRVSKTLLDTKWSV